jgi:hypothetical protein
MMRHTIISWDCSFRNFFHLIDGLLAQNYPRDQFELIYVEQRTRENADEYNHRLGLRSLWDRYEEVRNEINLGVIYLDDLNSPYHLGKCNNAGLERAQGDIVSVMDGDLLLPKDFLTKLTAFHDRQVGVVNLVRRMCEYPVGVLFFKDWMRATVDFDQCLRSCKGRNAPIPKEYGNKGPLISARREFWDVVGGYDSHSIWSTSASTAGGDVNRRLELAARVESVALPDALAVHPWHPVGYARQARQNKEQLVRSYLALQHRLTNWSVQNNEPDQRRRFMETEKLYVTNRRLIETVAHDEFLNFQSGSTSVGLNRSVIPPMIQVMFNNRLASLRRVGRRLSAGVL